MTRFCVLDGHLCDLGMRRHAAQAKARSLGLERLWLFRRHVLIIARFSRAAEPGDDPAISVEQFDPSAAGGGCVGVAVSLPTDVDEHLPVWPHHHDLLCREHGALEALHPG